MPSVVGNILVAAVLAVIVFFAARACLRSLRDRLSGRASCGGGCAGCAADCGRRTVPADPELIERLKKKEP